MQVHGNVYELADIYGVDSNNTVTSNTTPAVDENATVATLPEEEVQNLCVICISDASCAAVLPCRHMCLCTSCADTFRTQSNKCPICRAIIDSIIIIPNEQVVPTTPDQVTLKMEE